MKVAALAGGVGGARLAAGLEDSLQIGGGELSVVVNTADDFDLWGLRICPDLDTVMYTLAGLENPDTGWGLAGETFATLEMLASYGEDPWFLLGDRDLATHLLRAERLWGGAALTEVTADLARRLGLRSQLLPMSDEPVGTVIHTPEGPLEFQEYFVRRGQRDAVLAVEFRGIGEARPTAAVREAVSGAEAVVLCPSNPLVSLGPILALPGMRELLSEASAPKVAVSPIVGGRALKGPADRMLYSLGHEVSATGVARIYGGLVDGMVIDRADRDERPAIEDLGMEVLATDAVMHGPPDRARLAEEVLGFAATLGRAEGGRG
ncbi:MAG: 2-phospho-L-lactate transferase [Rubrobacter sp.]|nr:2-phospho-L-lactate transferase [Rubrobacter sp.]